MQAHLLSINWLVVKFVTFIRMSDDIRSYHAENLIIKIRRRLKVHYFTITGGVIHQIISYAKNHMYETH